MEKYGLTTLGKKGRNATKGELRPSDKSSCSTQNDKKKGRLREIRTESESKSGTPHQVRTASERQKSMNSTAGHGITGKWWIQLQQLWRTGGRSWGSFPRSTLYGAFTWCAEFLLGKNPKSYLLREVVSRIVDVGANVVLWFENMS